MPLSTDVNLPRSHTPVFPSLCVRCDEETDGRTMRLWTHTVGWWTWLVWSFGWGFTVRVPACSGCGRVIRLQRVGGLFLCMAVAALVLLFVWPHLDGFVARPWHRWARMGLVLVCLSPWFVWETMFPPAIDLTAYSKSVDYEFRDEEYAWEFAELNSHAEWVNVD